MTQNKNTIRNVDKEWKEKQKKEHIRYLERKLKRGLTTSEKKLVRQGKL